MEFTSDITPLLTGFSATPLAAGRCAEGTLQSFSWRKTPPCAAGSGRGLGRTGRECTPVVNSCSKKWKSGFCTSPSSPSLFPLEWSCASFQEPKRLRDKQCILRYSGWGSSGQVQNSDLQIPREPGRDFLEIDTFRVKRPLNRIFHHFGLQEFASVLWIRPSLRYSPSLPVWRFKDQSKT